MSKNINVPKLRFEEFSGEWEDKFFGEIYTFLQTNSFSRALLNYEFGEVKNIHYGDIHTKFKSNFYLKKENVPYINEDVDISKLTNDNFCKEKDLVIADASEDYKDIGKTIEIIDLNNEKLVSGLHTYIARDAKDKMALSFGGYFMQTHNIRLQMMKFATGISVLGISKSNLVKIKIKIPQKEEQEKIAIFLSSIDEKIEKLTKKDELLQQYKKSIMQKIFSQEIRFKDDKGNEFPEWEEKKLKNICDVIKGEQLNKDNLTEIGDYPAINGGINPSGFTDKWNTLKNTITISEGGNSCGYVNFIKTNFWSGGHNYSLQNLKENIENRYLFQYLKYNESQIMNLRVGSGLPNIQKSDIVNFKILLPCIEEQDKIANFLSLIDDKIEENQKVLEKAKEFKKSLLQQMFI